MLNLTQKFLKRAIVFIFVLFIVNAELAGVAIALDTSMADVPFASIDEEFELEEILEEAPILFPDTEYKVSYSIKDSEDLLANIKSKVTELSIAINSGAYTTNACQRMTEEIARLEAVISKVESNIDKISSWEVDHYYASKIWLFLIQQGYSEVITSAIIGNMMIETSGGTLNLKPTIYNSTGDYYGLCQWSISLRPEVANMPFETQLEYLHSDMEKEFKTFGKCYYNGFTYDDFISMTDPAEAAYAFAVIYERCGSGSYYPRQQAALEAYNYFNLNS